MRYLYLTVHTFWLESLIRESDLGLITKYIKAIKDSIWPAIGRFQATAKTSHVPHTKPHATCGWAAAHATRLAAPSVGTSRRGANAPQAKRVDERRG